MQDAAPGAIHLRINFFVYLITLLTFQPRPDLRLPAFHRQYPRPINPRRIMTTMLSVAAFQIRYLIVRVIQMETYDSALHRCEILLI